MTQRLTYIKPLLLAGGRSTRMGSPKSLLPMPDGRPLYLHLIDLLREICPESPKIYLSLARDSPVKDTDIPSDIEIIYDLEANESGTSAGPAAGLLAAHSADPEATWIVVACDFPLLTPAALEQLRQAYTPPVTCFRTSEGFCESLVGIWSPDALRGLVHNVEQGRTGPSIVVRQLGGLMIEPPKGYDSWLWDVDTKEDWQAALEKLEHLTARLTSIHAQ